MSDWRFCVAPMMDWSDRHCRYFWRLMSRHTRLYTEMVTTGALIHGDRNRFLQFHNAEHPIALQLGGSDPKDLATGTRMATDYGYDEINLNCGCPSDRVQEGRIGACLMAEPNTVADCVSAMRTATALPVTVKHRIGVDDLDSEEHLHHFVSTVAAAGCTVFIVHARKAWLQGLSPKQNREIPPLDYGSVARLKQTFPNLTIVINGGITSLRQSRNLLETVDGVMLGREAYHNPYILATVDQDLFGNTSPICSRDEVFDGFLDYCKDQLHRGVKLNHMTRHLMGLYAGQPGGRLFRRYLSDHATRPGAGIEVLINAQAQLVQTAMDVDSMEPHTKYSS
jgi:tRNA-dihydrouridine synthase A